MKRFDIKSLAAGILIGTMGVSTAYAAGVIKTAEVSPSKVYFYNKQVPMKSPLISVTMEGSTDKQLYMPVKDILEYMNFKVNISDKDGSVNLTMNGFHADGINTIKSGFKSGTIDSKAIDIIQKTGNWKYIEPYLPKMTADGIKKAVDIYNSKHPNESEHKNASDYIK